MSVLAARPALEELDRRDVDAEPVLRRAHLSRELLESAEGRLPHRSVADLWEGAAHAAADPWLALHVAETLAARSYDLYDYLIATAETIGDGLEAAARYAHLVHGESAWGLSVDGGEARLVRHVPVASPQLDELAVVSVLVRSRRASGVDWSPERLALQHHRLDDDGELARRCGCPVAFGAPETELRLAPALLATPHLASTAATLHLSVRTLQRRLADSGVTHSGLLDDVRRRLALELVAQTRVPMAEIANRLGFGDSTAFHRAFMRWAGAAPTEHRRRHRA